MRLRWKRKPAITGLARIGSGTQGSTLHDGQNEFANTNYQRATDSWFWVARNDEFGVPLVNTYRSPNKSEQEAKDQAMSYVKQKLSEKGTA